MKIKISDYTNTYQVDSSENQKLKTSEYKISILDGEISIVQENTLISYPTAEAGDITDKTGLITLTQEDILFIVDSAANSEGIGKLLNKEKFTAIENQIIASEQKLNEERERNKNLKQSIYLSRSIIEKHI